MSTTEILERRIAERDEVRTAAIAMASADDFNPDDKTYVELRSQAEGLDKSVSELATLLTRQQAADAQDSGFSKAQKRTEREARTETRESWGEAFTRSEQFAQYQGRGTSQRFEVEMRALPATIASMASALPAAPIYDLTPPVLPPSLLPLVERDQRDRWRGGQHHVVEGHGSGRAQVVRRGGSRGRPEAADRVEADRDVGLAGDDRRHDELHTALAADVAAVVSYINGELQNEIRRKIEEEAQAALAAATLDSVTGASLLAALRMGMAAVQGKGYVPNGFTVSADDLASMDLAAMDAGNSGPVRTGTYWGLTPVIDWTKEPVTRSRSATSSARCSTTSAPRSSCSAPTATWTTSRTTSSTRSQEARAKTVVTRPDALVEATRLPDPCPSPRGEAAQEAARLLGRVPREA